jgi:hypothetical protein
MLALVLALALTASDDDLVAGRPGWTEARGVVQAGVVQLEAGWVHTAGSTDVDAPSEAIPGGVLRVGLGAAAEVRIANVGVDALQVGGKIMLASESRAHLEVGLVPTITVPTGARAIGAATVDPALAVSLGRALPGGFDAIGQVKVARLRLDAQRATQYSSGANVSHDVSGGWNGFGELYIISGSGVGAAAWNAAAGVARRIGRHSQVDVEINRAISGASPAWSLGVGIVVRR